MRPLTSRTGRDIHICFVAFFGVDTEIQILYPHMLFLGAFIVQSEPCDHICFVAFYDVGTEIQIWYPHMLFIFSFIVQLELRDDQRGW